MPRAYTIADLEKENADLARGIEAMERRLLDNKDAYCQAHEWSEAAYQLLMRCRAYVPEELLTQVEGLLGSARPSRDFTSLFRWESDKRRGEGWL